eukprot:1369309-Ditylum_brightwellii.AAC.1
MMNAKQPQKKKKTTPSNQSALLWQTVESVGERCGGALAGGDAGCSVVGGGVLGDFHEGWSKRRIFQYYSYMYDFQAFIIESP